MMAMMEKTPDSPNDPVQDFLTTGRTGRRNAMPDILGEHASTTTGDLPDCLRKLDTSDSPSKVDEPEASTSGVGPSSTGKTLSCSTTLTQKPTTPPQGDPSSGPDGANS